MMIAFSAGGRRAATCSAVEAAPGDADHADLAACTRAARASQAMTSHGVVLLLLQVFVPSIRPSESPRAAHVDAHAGIAVAGEVGMGAARRVRRCRRACGRAGIPGSPAPGRARRLRAARSGRPGGVPSASGDPDSFECAHRPQRRGRFRHRRRRYRAGAHRAVTSATCGPCATSRRAAVGRSSCLSR